MFGNAELVLGYPCNGAALLDHICDSWLAFTAHSKGRRYLSQPIANKRERSRFLLFITQQGLRGIGANDQYLSSCCLEVRICHAEPARFDVSTRRERFREKVQYEVTVLPEIGCHPAVSKLKIRS